MSETFASKMFQVERGAADAHFNASKYLCQRTQLRTLETVG